MKGAYDKARSEIANVVIPTGRPPVGFAYVSPSPSSVPVSPKQQIPFNHTLLIIITVKPQNLPSSLQMSEWISF